MDRQIMPKHERHLRWGKKSADIRVVSCLIREPYLDFPKGQMNEIIEGTNKKKSNLVNLEKGKGQPKKTC